MGKKVFAIVLVLLISLSPFTNVCGHEINGSLYSPSYVVMSSETGQILLSREANSPANISLLFKMMVSLVALENLSTASKAPVEDVVYSVPDLVKLTMLTENPEATLALADLISEEGTDCISVLNQKAKEMGLTGTIFADTVTLDKPDFIHSSTTLIDVANFIFQALNNREFKQLYCSQATTLSADGTLISNSNDMVLAAGNSRNVGGTTTSYNHNNEIFSSMSFLGNITGYNNNLSIDLIIVADHMFGIDDSVLCNNLISNISQNYYKKAIFSKGESLLSYTLGNEVLEIIVSKDVYCIVSNSTVTPVSQVSFVMNEGYDFEHMEPPVHEGTVLGTANLQLYDGSIINVPVEAGNTVYNESSRINDIITIFNNNKQVSVLIIGFVIIEFILLFFKIRSKK